MTANCRKQKGAEANEDAAGLANVEGHRGSLIVTQHVKFDRLLVAKLLEECEHRTWIADVDAIDLLEDIPVFQSNLFIKA